MNKRDSETRPDELRDVVAAARAMVAGVEPKPSDKPGRVLLEVNRGDLEGLLFALGRLG